MGVNLPPWQARVMAESRRAELMKAAVEARSAASAVRRRAPLWASAAEKSGLFLIRRGERLRRDALRHGAAPVS